MDLYSELNAMGLTSQTDIETKAVNILEDGEVVLTIDAKTLTQLQSAENIINYIKQELGK